jgi:hypothetical protein
VRVKRYQDRSAFRKVCVNTTLFCLPRILSLTNLGRLGFLDMFNPKESKQLRLRSARSLASSEKNKNLPGIEDDVTGEVD